MRSDRNLIIRIEAPGTHQWSILSPLVNTAKAEIKSSKYLHGYLMNIL
jgi:hypothetical protein